MSLNGHKEVRRIFAGFKVQQVALKYSCMAATAAARAATRSRTPDQQLLL